MIKTVSENNNNIFENKVNDLLDEGYEISSTCCGYAREVGGSACDCEYWMAVLIKKGSDV